jgi:hypothetical protein
MALPQACTRIGASDDADEGSGIEFVISDVVLDCREEDATGFDDDTEISEDVAAACREEETELQDEWKIRLHPPTHFPFGPQTGVVQDMPQDGAEYVRSMEGSSVSGSMMVSSCTSGSHCSPIAGVTILSPQKRSVQVSEHVVRPL